ncbi:hypothetical protein Tam10B_0804 [Bifidobacterium vansinderenii]|uniref:Uncharacterized protein n=1 Tax=Bifidobacterium vansinderenii TaxID=1984871 RepID=A0A229VYZ9_9BIFI|nr:hypothetical protein Tam10B_0804 [Bifidobacterium vansinderenii]
MCEISQRSVDGDETISDWLAQPVGDPCKKNPALFRIEIINISDVKKSVTEFVNRFYEILFEQRKVFGFQRINSYFFAGFQRRFRNVAIVVASL